MKRRIPHLARLPPRWSEALPEWETYNRKRDEVISQEQYRLVETRREAEKNKPKNKRPKSSGRQKGAREKLEKTLSKEGQADQMLLEIQDFRFRTGASEETAKAAIADKHGLTVGAMESRIKRHAFLKIDRKVAKGLPKGRPIYSPRKGRL